jgi:signal transduction histidine kinase
LATHVEHPPHDDFFKLSDSLEHMLTRMRDSLVEQERLREQLCRSEKLALIGQLAAMVAHEVNNPLDGLQNGIRIIRRKGQHDQQSEELLELMDNGLYRIEMIVRRLLTLSRNEPIHPNPTPFDRLVEDALTFVRPKFNRNNIATDCDLGSPPVVGMIDENQFAHVLVNLMINAADAMPDGGTLTVRARPGDDPTRVLLEVLDTGIGIDEAHLPHVFEPFYTTKPSQQGSGLGLAVVERIVEAHDGRIEIDTTPGKGTRFAISLPAAGSESMNRAADSACTTSS